MEDDYSSWIGFPKSSKEYVRGIKAFMENSFPIHAKGEEMKCPCKVCVNRYWHTQTVIYDHLIYSGPSPLHMKWICEVSHTKVDGSTDFMDSGTGMDFEDNLGEMFNCIGKKFRDLENDYESLTNAEARKFYGHVREGKQPLYPGSTKFSRLSFLIKLYHLKCAHGISESAFGELLELIRDAFPDAQIPLSLNAAKNMIKDLGLHYEKIHACRNNCMLYWGENKDKEKCDNCDVSRWVLLEKKGNDASDPGQVIHKVPANVMRYFPLKPRLQRLYMCMEYSKLMKWHDVGRQQDGKVRHPADTEAWKTIDADYPDFSLENRNVSLGVASDGFNPYRSMNLSHNSPKNSIDVFMQPLIAELKELWEVGVNTYDALADKDFNLRARVLWTISDFSGYAMLSGWSTKGKLGCPVCHYETSSLYLKHSKKMCYMNHRKFLPSAHKWRMDTKRFNGAIEMGHCPSVLTGTDIEDLLSGGKTKDHVAARKDLQEMGIRKPLHPVLSEDGAHHEIRAAIFDLSNKKKEIFCSVLENTKLSYGCASNIGRYVHTKERKVVGYKSHDAHFILHYLLQFAIKKTTKADVTVPLMKLSACLRALWSKVIDLEELEKLETEIVEVLCQFEMIFPSAFFDIMVHLLVHLTREVRLGGPQHLRNMFPIERYLAKLKSYVCNRSKPEGSIAEGYIAEEYVTFCSRFLAADETTKTTCAQQFSKEGQHKLNIISERVGIKMELLFIWKMLIGREHQALVDSHENTNRYKRARRHTAEFWDWLREEVGKMVEVSSDLGVFALGPNRTARRFTGYVVNGYRFHTSDRDSRCTTQNSSVYLTAQTTSFSSSRDENPIVGDVSYYGSIEDIIELDYWGLFTVVLFKCRW
ncbi:uncharacterized protein LOC141718530 [Apium graveolens]|uniref:uncharacterized protein LOC141718530 n=1 Tax=Apium graveolens TaxID=4045 RepID=UPI003D79AA3C